MITAKRKVSWQAAGMSGHAIKNEDWLLLKGFIEKNKIKEPHGRYSSPLFWGFSMSTSSKLLEDAWGRTFAYW